MRDLFQWYAGNLWVRGLDSLALDRHSSVDGESMALEMRMECEKCGAPLIETGEARICSLECTFCTSCAADMAETCPNCSGELVARPRRPKL